MGPPEKPGVALGWGSQAAGPLTYLELNLLPAPGRKSEEAFGLRSLLYLQTLKTQKGHQPTFFPPRIGTLKMDFKKDLSIWATSEKPWRDDLD